jgi:DNA-binding transcriptional ArsR family regulator
MAIFKVIYPRARLSIIDALIKQQSPVPLRQLAKISRLSLKAAQVNVVALEKMGLILSSKKGNTLQISLNERHSLFKKVREILQILERSSLRERGKALTNKAKNLLKFIDEGAALISQAKNSK